MYSISIVKTVKWESWLQFIPNYLDDKKNVNKQGAHSPGLVRDVYICMSMFTFYNPVALYGSSLVIGFILYPSSW